MPCSSPRNCPEGAARPPEAQITPDISPVFKKQGGLRTDAARCAHPLVDVRTGNLETTHRRADRPDVRKSGEYRAKFGKSGAEVGALVTSGS